MKTKIHWNLYDGKWTVRTYKGCDRHSKVLIKSWESEVNPELKDNPRGWVYSDHTNVIVEPSETVLQTLKKKERLIYNKREMFFNITQGDMLLCDNEGCFVVEETNTNINSPK